MGFAVTARLESIETTTPEPPNHRAIGNAFLLKGDPAVHLIEDCGVFAVGYPHAPDRQLGARAHRRFGKTKSDIAHQRGGDGRLRAGLHTADADPWYLSEPFAQPV